MHEPMRSPCARLVLLMHSLERADNWRSIIGNYTQQRSVCSILIIWNNVNVSMPEVLRSALGGKTRVLRQPGSNLKRRFGIKHNVALLMAVTVLILNVIAWRATEATGTSDGA